MKDRRRYLAGGGCFGAGLLLLAAARKIPGFGEWYREHVYRGLAALMGGFWAIVPFSAAELAVYLLLAALAAGIIKFRKNFGGLASRTVLLAGILFLLYAANCGVNYYSRPFSSFLPYGKEEHTAGELEKLLIYLTEQVNRYSHQAGIRLDPGEYGKEGRAAMKALGEEYPCLAGFYPRPKYLTFPWILSVQQLAGIYSPFTVEANYNNAMVPYNIPHTICHELSHLKGFMKEDEANFIGFLACLKSENQSFLYSGYLMGWIYAGNALAAEDPMAYWEIRSRLDERAARDLEENSRFWDRYEGKAAEAAEAMNDAYLKSNDQKEGVRSYGMVVDLMLGWAKQRGIH